MRRMRAIAAGAACLVALSLSATAHERCGCRAGGGEVLNGRLNTSDFDGGVGDRFGDGGAVYGGSYAMASGGGSAGAFASSSAFASAHASAYAHASFSSHSSHGGHGGGHGGGHY